MNNFKAGFVAVVGRPNTGKSTLVNALVGSKIVITSHHPNTTRNPIRGIVNRDNYQIILVDTPGMHKPKTALGTIEFNLVPRAVFGLCIPGVSTNIIWYQVKFNG